MNQAQAARQTPGEEPAKVEVPPGFESERKPGGDRKPGGERFEQSFEPPSFEPGRERETESMDLEESEFESTDLDDEEDIGRMTVRILSRARRRIREQPLTAATGAFIFGFAVGNGVPKFLARAGIAIGLRMVMQRMFDRAEMFESDE